MDILKACTALIVISVLSACSTADKQLVNSNSRHSDDAEFQKNSSNKFEKFLYAKGLYEQGKLSQALPVLVELAQQQTSFSEVYLYLANIHFKNNKYPNASENYRACLAIDPNNAFALFNLSLVDIIQSEQRLASLQELIPATHPNFEKATQLRRDLNLLMGQKSDAATLTPKQVLVKPSPSQRSTASKQPLKTTVIPQLIESAVSSNTANVKPLSSKLKLGNAKSVTMAVRDI